jgi:nicotinamidase-related amidase
MGIAFPPAGETALIVIDIQDRLCRAMPELPAAQPVMEKAVRIAALLGVRTLVTEQYPKGLGPTLPELRESLPAAASVFSKTAFSCWGCAEFAAAVTEMRPSTLVLIGMETHVCLQQTAIDSLRRGYQVVVLADAVCSRKATDRDAALAFMRSRGIVVTTLEALAFDWLGDAQHPDFRALSRIVK